MRQDLYSDMYTQEEFYWWHKAKRQLVKQFLPRRKNLKILDIGCGTGKLMEELKPYGKVWGIDASKQAIAFCQQRHLTRVYHEDFPKLKHVNTQFDVITCLDVLEHIANDTQALRMIKKLLKPHGRAIITVPAYQWLFSYWDTILGHQRRYGNTELEQKVKKANLAIVKLSFVYSFLLPLVIPFRLIRHKLFRAKTPTSDFIKLPSVFHSLFFFLATIEQKIIAKATIPFGVSLLCIMAQE